MSVVAGRKCVQHPAREAVARCPSCAGNFCAECVVEHDGRLLCVRCLEREKIIAAPARSQLWPRVRGGVSTAASVILLWALFYFMGSTIRLIPSRVHDGTVWRTLTAPTHGEP
ncbi:rhomboid family protein [Oleiharenicola lentus]|uniref:rhomboid family protein n=1 Tax=Oleiharenicola lentus TaxID=2508720 RepID=UPI003F66E24C